jgi:CxxC motif-containing protein
MVSVKTVAPIPKENIFDLMEIIRATSVQAPVAIGDVICKNLYGTDVVATKAID